jgi:hypothetical protein
MTFDPTFGVPSVESSWASRLVAPELIAAIGRAVGAAVPEPLKHAVGAVARSVVHAAGALAAAWPVVLGVVAVVALGLAASRLRRRRAGPRAPTDRVGQAFEEVVNALEPFGHRRAPSTTPSEYLEGVMADDGLDLPTREEVAVVVRTLERERFAPPHARPGASESERAAAAARAVRERVGAR